MPDIGLLQGGRPRAPLSNSGDAGLILNTAPQPIRASDLLWLALALIVIVGTGIGLRDPWPADEPRFASLARDMAQSGEWLFPRVGGDLYQDKPPLYFWLLALSYSLFGAMRGWFLIPSLLAAGGVVFLVYDFGRRLVSRTAGIMAALLVLTTLQFVLAARGAQIDPMLCFFITLSLYAFLRHLLLGPAWGWYVAGGLAAGCGVITKGVGFLPLLLLVPYFLMRRPGWNGMASVAPSSGAGGWRWWLAPLASLLVIALWLVPMLIAAANGAGEYAAYRDEILFTQTVSRYAAAWHHLKPWYYFPVEVIPPLWLPWSVLLFWLVPRFKNAWTMRDARVWLPLAWLLLVLLFFTASPGKRGIYILPALPALAFASLPVLTELLARPAVRRAGLLVAGFLWVAITAIAIAYVAGVESAVKVLSTSGLDDPVPLFVFTGLGALALALTAWRAPLMAWPAVIGVLTVVFSFSIGPDMNPERSSAPFVRGVLGQVRAGETLALVAYKEQFLLYLDRPTVNFGHRRWREGGSESEDAAAWLNAGANRVLLVPEDLLEPCFGGGTLAGRASREDWYLVRPPADAQCAAQGDARRAIHYRAAIR